VLVRLQVEFEPLQFDPAAWRVRLTVLFAHWTLLRAEASATGRLIRSTDLLSIFIRRSGVVNGPGEAKEADIGIAGCEGDGVLFKKGKVIRKVPQEKLVDVLLKEVRKYKKLTA